MYVILVKCEHIRVEQVVASVQAVSSSCLSHSHTHTHTLSLTHSLTLSLSLVVQEVGEGEGDEGGARPGPAGSRQHCPLLPLVGGAGSRGLAASGAVGAPQQNRIIVSRNTLLRLQFPGPLYGHLEEVVLKSPYCLEERVCEWIVG